MTSRVVGVDKLIERFSLMIKKAPVAAAFGEYEGMQEIMIVAKERAPKDTWTMANSGYVSPPDVRGGESIIEAGFGGGSEEYVVRQHEDSELNHPNGGEAFFFQSALDDGEAALMETIARHVEEALSTGATHPPAKKVPADPLEQPGDHEPLPRKHR